MDKILSVLRKPAKLIVLICVAAYTLFELLYTIGIMTDGDEASIVSALFFLICFGGLAAALIFALVKQNTKVSRFIGTMLFGYLAIRLMYSLLNGGGAGTDISAAIFAFDFLAELSAMAVLAIVILRLFMEKLNDNKVLDIVSIVCVGAYILFEMISYFLVFGLYGYYAKEYDYHVEWYFIIGNLASLVLLGAILFGYILLFTKDEGSKEEPKEVDDSEWATDEEIESVEEKPAENTEE